MSLFSPALVLSIIVASLYGAAFHLLWAPRNGKLIVYWAAALGGFALGHLLAHFSPLHVVIGNVNILEATLVSWAAMIIAKQLKL